MQAERRPVKYASARPGFSREDASDIRPIPKHFDTPAPFPVFWDKLVQEKLLGRERVALELVRARKRSG
jgi:hypothetical protein